MQTQSISLQALLAIWVKPSRVISARNPQALDLRPAPCMRQGCRQAANGKRARHSRRATKTCRNEDKQRQADTIGSRALCVPPRGCCVPSAPRLQMHSHRCPLAGAGSMFRHLGAHRPGFRCELAGAHRPGSRCTGASRPGSGHAGGHSNHAGTHRPGSKCKLAGAYHRPGCCGSVCTYPPPVTRANPWAQGILARLVIRSAGPVPSPV